MTIAVHPFLNTGTNMRTRSFVVALGIIALSTSRLSAQTCAGAAAFSAGPVRAGAGLATSDGVKSYGVNMAVGAKSGTFASANIARAEYSDIDGSGTLVGIGAGYAADLDPAKTVQFCPQVSYTHQSGPDLDFGTGTIATSAYAIGLGGSFGSTVPVSPTLDLVPFGGASYFISRASATMDDVTDSESQNYTELTLGAGFVFNKTLTLQPAVSIPLGLEGAKSSFQLAFAFNFGAPKH
jgi:hypothetical protein